MIRFPITLWYTVGSILLAGPAGAQWRDRGPGYGPGMMGWAGGGWFGPIIMFLFWIFVVLGIIYLVKAIAGLARSKEEDSALDIVRQRYAKGEITREEFERLKADLAPPGKPGRKDQGN